MAKTKAKQVVEVNLCCFVVVVVLVVSVVMEIETATTAYVELYVNLYECFCLRCLLHCVCFID